MQAIETVAALRAALRPPTSAASSRIGFVPTMGNLHDGHLDLVRVARERVGASGTVVVSIFVNRLQFGAGEDFDRYPRTFEADCARCREAGVDFVFAPNETELYPVPQSYTVVPNAIESVLEGAIRPGHFRGVATVVLKLFNIVQPHVAVFGKKDYQQCRVIANLVEQFNLPVELEFAETVRAQNGLALSSRNGYLSEEQRIAASVLHRVLRGVRDAVEAGSRDYEALCALAQDELCRAGMPPDYLELRRQSDLGVPVLGDEALVVLAAVRLGPTRLIDNLEVQSVG